MANPRAGGASPTPPGRRGTVTRERSRVQALDGRSRKDLARRIDAVLAILRRHPARRR